MPDVSTPSAEWVTMELSRSLPSLLDSQRPDGGVMRLLQDPGGKIGQAGVKSPVDSSGSSHGGVDAAAALTRQKLLIQHAHELSADFAFRAAITAPDDGYWNSVASLAGRPFADGVKVENVPKSLAPGGEIYEDVDGQGNSIPAFLAEHARGATGYGIGYIHTRFDEAKGRPFWGWVPGRSMIVVIPGATGPVRMHVFGKAAGGFEEGARAAQRPEEVAQVTVFELVEGEDGAAVVQVSTFTDDDGFEDEPDEPPMVIDRQTSIPLDAMRAGPMTPSHFIQPMLLAAAALDFQLLQVSSNHVNASIQANTFLRFAAGLNPTDVEDWATQGPKQWYGTTAEKARMEIISPNPGSLDASAALEDHIKRKIEVAGLAPLMTRQTGDEKATGQAIAASRARSAWTAVAHSWESTASTALGRLAAYIDGDNGDEPPKVILTKDFGLSPEKQEAARFIASVYAEPTAGMGRIEFWQQLQELGLKIDVEPEEMALWAEQANPERQKIQIQRAQQAIDARETSGLLGGSEGEKAVYRQMILAGSLTVPPETDPEKWIETLVEEKDREPTAAELAAAAPTFPPTEPPEPGEPEEEPEEE